MVSPSCTQLRIRYTHKLYMYIRNSVLHCTKWFLSRQIWLRKQQTNFTHTQFPKTLCSLSRTWDSPGMAWLYMPYPHNFWVRSHTSIWLRPRSHFETVLRPWLISHSSHQTQKEWSPLAEQSFGMFNICTHSTVFELYVTRKKIQDEQYQNFCLVSQPC